MWNDLAIVSVFACLAAMLSHFIDYCIQEGEVFGFWQKILDKLEGTAIQNPLGGCVVCMNVWICVFSFWGLLVFDISWLWFLPYIIISSTITRILASWL